MKRYFGLALITSVIGMSMSLNSCYYDNAEDLYPADTTAVLDTNIVYTYNGHTKAIIDGNCATAGCHIAGTGRQPFTTYAEVSAAIQNFVEARGYSVVFQLVGHGCGFAVHEAPAVPNFGKKGQGILLRPGLTFCIEPMINLGEARVETQSNGHTFVTADRSLSAHFEHTVAVTEKGCLVLTK